MEEECESSEKCISGQCVDPCLSKTSCGLNAHCKTENHIVQCNCPVGFTGNQDVECVRSKLMFYCIQVFHLFIYGI